MDIVSHIPSEALRPFIRTYLLIESGSELVNRVLPSTSLAVAFRYKGEVSYVTDNHRDKLPVFAVSGLRKSVRLINYRERSATIIVLLKEAGAAAFFREPLHELFEQSVPLDTFITRLEASLIEEQLAEAKNDSQRLLIIESFFLSRLRAPKPDKLIAAIIQKMYSVKGSIPMKALSDTFYISQDALEKRFRKSVGTSPKQFSALIRMQAIINQGRLHGKVLFETAFDGGYYDQAHFNKEFKLFTGLTPTEFFRSASFW